MVIFEKTNSLPCKYAYFEDKTLLGLSESLDKPRGCGEGEKEISGTRHHDLNCNLSTSYHT